MLILLSPSKTLDFDTPPPVKKSTRPALREEAGQLVARLREFPPAQLGRLMGVSDRLAAQVFDHFRLWQDSPKPARGKQALFAYQGDVYAGLDAGSLSAADIDHAQQHLRILSGLYGVLRPLDVIQPYRLEMGAPLAAGGGKNLYEYWGDRVTRELKKALRKGGVVLNLASQEYFKAVDAAGLDTRVITPTFKDKKDGKYRFMSFYGKKARGQMARYLIQRRLKRPDSLKKSYDVDGYRYNKGLSTDDQWVFTREEGP